MTTYPLLLSSLAVAAALAGCAGVLNDPAATAELKPTTGSTVTGKVHFLQHKHGMVKVTGQVSGLKPNSEHGFHIHELGNCADNGNAAGGHFNPTGGSHGKYDAPMHHMGDLPSLKSDANGVAKLNMESKDLTLLAGAGNIVGRGVIVHANPDDYVSQPTGNAGGRIGCGVIVRDEQ